VDDFDTIIFHFGYSKLIERHAKFVTEEQATRVDGICFKKFIAVQN